MPRPRATHYEPPRNGKLAKRPHTPPPEGRDIYSAPSRYRKRTSSPSPERRDIYSAPPRLRRLRSGYEEIQSESVYGRKRRGRGRPKHREDYFYDQDLSPISPVEKVRVLENVEDRTHSGARFAKDYSEKGHYTSKELRRKPVGSGARPSPLNRNSEEGINQNHETAMLAVPPRPGMSRDPSSGCSIVMRPGETRRANEKDLKFYIEAFRQFPHQVKSHYTSDDFDRDGKPGKKGGIFSRLSRSFGRKNKKGKWMEVREEYMPAERAESFAELLTYVDSQCGGGPVFYKKEKIDGCTYHTIKYRHLTRGVIQVCHRDWQQAVNEMIYELEFQDARRYNLSYIPLYELLDRKYPSAIVLQKIDRFGRYQVKVEDKNFAFRTCAEAAQEAALSMCYVLQYDIAQRHDPRFRAWGDVFVATDLVYPGSLILFDQPCPGQWHCKIVHDLEGEVAEGKGVNLNMAMEQLSVNLASSIERHQKEGKLTGTWNC